MTLARVQSLTRAACRRARAHLRKPPDRQRRPRSRKRDQGLREPTADDPYTRQSVSASTVDHEPMSILMAFRGAVHTTTSLPWGFGTLRRFSTGQRPTPGLPPRLCCAFRLSQPLDALFHPEPSGLVSCRWRPWASTFGGFPLQVADPPLDVPSPPAVCTERSLRPPGQRCETNTTARVYASRRSVPSGLVLPGNRRSILP